MEWNKKSIIQFIEVYRKHGILWDTKHPNYYNKVRKQETWEEVGKRMQRTVDDCKKKMEYLLSAMRREKMKKSKSSVTRKGANEVYKSSWFAFESMQFLWDKNKPRPTLTTLQTPTTSQGDTPVKEAEDENQGNPLTTSSHGNSRVHQNKYTHTKRTQTTPPPSSKSKFPRDERLDKAFEILQSASAADDSYYFGNYVAYKLREYDSNTRLSIQTDIMTLFARANEGYYSNVSCLPSLVTTQSPSYSASLTFSDLSNSN